MQPTTHPHRHPRLTSPRPRTAVMCGAAARPASSSNFFALFLFLISACVAVCVSMPLYSYSAATVCRALRQAAWSILPQIYLSTHLSVPLCRLVSLPLLSLCLHLSIHYSISVSLLLYVYPVACLFPYLYVCLSVFCFTYIYLSICLSLALSISLSLSLSLSPSPSPSLYLPSLCRTVRQSTNLRFECISPSTSQSTVVVIRQSRRNTPTTKSPTPSSCLLFNVH